MTSSDVRGPTKVLLQGKLSAGLLCRWFHISCKMPHLGWVVILNSFSVKKLCALILKNDYNYI